MEVLPVVLVEDRKGGEGCFEREGMKACVSAAPRQQVEVLERVGVGEDREMWEDEAVRRGERCCGVRERRGKRGVCPPKCEERRVVYVADGRV